MRLNTLKPNPGARHRKRRVGCGESSGRGKTCGRGHKGQKSRAGGGAPPGFEGGQMPLYRRIPRRGFNNARFRDKILIVNVGTLEERFDAGATINEAALRAANLVKGTFDGIKVLGEGDVSKAFQIEGLKVSNSAKEKIVKAGGSISAAVAASVAPAE
jgi:large subunit ribosomal protein L15